MSTEMMVALYVKQDEIYAQYRAAMRPLLEQHGGGFKNEEGRPINRVFAIYFKDKENMDMFFSHPDYLVIKAKYFEASVEATTIISSYDR
jgi:uncharacterized protein (DUF1330 family)